ncbi:response regulator transcription factor [Tautonia plasticadhaerens]|uniref:Transcriptional activator protein CzcR n=1 Tax=Tautonia plasticadhaerens TaxID=2527974 RepID=A0A518HC49_9BACT|nr:response regulator transcription factor [Tautonia plasticadhaerens]QDV38431.1 Transcriptional activator protein CzcR [Tautonia plasticadhaerens]
MRVLVIEDEPDLRRALVQSLREEGYAVDQAGDGTEGLYKGATWDYDAIVLDLMLPGIDGWDVLERLRREKGTPVLILTARDALGDRVRGLDAGADDYLVKPFALGELLARLRALIRRSAGRPHPEIRIDEVVVDTATRTVSRAGVPITLTAREYALVELLAMHRGTLIPRSMIYDRLFGEEDDTMSNVVEVHVSHIRKKLGREFIATRRGQGYIIDA